MGMMMHRNKKSREAKQAASSEKSEQRKYTKTEISKMSVSELKALAEENGIESSGASGAKLKETLIAKLV